jgi:tRNA-dihydrouridine synthase B
LNIGPYKLPNPIALAPMAGVTDLPFRRLCRKLGAGYVVSEMIASDPRLRGTRKSRLRANHEGEVEPIAVQIAGSEPQWMADTARYNVQLGAQIIDINMGCPARKVCNRMAGSALLEDEALVGEILTAVVGSVSVPVTLKIRTGPSPERRNGIRIAQLAEQKGVAALAVHGRTRTEKFSGQAEFGTIRDICRNISIPVFANGDVLTPLDAVRILEFTGADGLMIGRGAQGNPWIFREILHYLKCGRCLEAPAPAEVHAVMKAHLHDLHTFYGERSGVLVARKHIGWYLSGRPGGQAMRSRLMKAITAAGQIELINEYFFSAEKLAA